MMKNVLISGLAVTSAAIFMLGTATPVYAGHHVRGHHSYQSCTTEHTHTADCGHLADTFSHPHHRH